MATSNVHQLLRSFCTSVQDLDLSQQIQLAVVFMAPLDPQIVLSTAFGEAELHLKSQVLQQPPHADSTFSYILSCIAASVHLLKHGAQTLVINQYVDQVFIPVLKLQVGVDRTKQQLQVAIALSQIIRSHGSWSCALRIVKALAHALDERALPTHAPADPSDPMPSHLNDAHWPLSSICFTIQQLLHAASSVPDNAAAACSFLEASMKLLLPSILGLLSVDDTPTRQSAVHKLLPALADAASHIGGEVENTFYRAVAESCIKGMGNKGPSRQSAMALAVQFCGVLQQQLAGQLASQRNQFWSALRACLVDPEPLTRKRAVHVLCAMLDTSNTHTPGWATWLMLYNMLDDFAIHLIRPAWEQIRVLHPTAAEYVAEEQQQPTSVPPNQRKLRGRKTAAGAATGQQDSTSDETPASTEAETQNAAPKPADTAPTDTAATSPAPAPEAHAENLLGRPELQPQEFIWMRIIWERAFLHANIQVQKLALHSFLQRRWDPEYLATVPLDFMQHVLLTAILVHTQLKMSSNKSFDVQGALTQYLAGYVTALSEADRQDLFRIVLGITGAKDPLPRQGLLLLLGSFSAAAMKVQELLPATSSAGGWSEEVCACLVTCTLSIGSYHGHTFRTAAYRHTLQLAAALTGNSSLGLASAARLLQELPFDGIVPGGCLHDLVIQWLAPDLQAQEWFASNMLQLLESYLKDASGTAGAQLTDADIKVWEARSRSLALLAVAGDEAVTPFLRPLLQALAANMQAIRTRPYLAPGIAERTLILLDALLFYTLAYLRGQSIMSKSTDAQSMAVSCPLASALASLISSHTALLAACCESAVQVFWAVPPHLANAGVSATPGHSQSSEPQHHTSPALKVAGNKALKGASCVAQALEFVALRSESGGPSLTSALSHLLKWAQDFILACQKLNTRHLQERGHTDLLQDLMQALEGVSRSLSAASRAVALKVADKLNGAVNTAALLMKVLQIDEGSGRDRSPRHWSCIDAVLGLHVSLWNAPGSIQDQHSGRNGSSGIEPNTAAELLLSALQTLPGCMPSLLMPLLRCTRILWAMSLADKSIAAATATKLDAISSKEGQTNVDAVAWAVSRALLEALDLCSKRRAAMCAAFVNTAMLPTVLAYKDDDAELKALHEPGGPMHWLLDALTRLNRPRVVLPLCLRLAQHLITQPQLMAHYTHLLQHLLVYAALNKGGSGLDLESSTDVVESEELGALLQPEPDDLQQSHAGTTIAARLALICALHSVAQLAGIIHPLLRETNPDDTEGTGDIKAGGLSRPPVLHVASGDAYASKAREAGLQLWRKLYTLACKDPLLSADKYKVGSDLHRQKVRCWQTLTVLSSYVPEEQMEEVVKQLMELFNQNNPSQVKMYQEAVCTALLLRSSSLLERLLLPDLQDVSKGRNNISSLILVSAQVALNLPSELKQKVLPKVVEAILPWGLCHAHTVRTFTQLVLHTIWTRVPLDSPIWGAYSPGPSLLQRWMEYLDGNHDMIRLRNTLGAVMPRFTPHGLTSPQRVFVEGVQLAGGSEDGVMFEGAPASIIDQLLDFLNSERNKLREALHEREVEQEYFPDTGLSMSSKSKSTTQQSQPPSHTTEGAGDFQRKLSPTNRLVLPAADSYDPVAELAEFSKLGLWDDPSPQITTLDSSSFTSPTASSHGASATTPGTGSAAAASGSAVNDAITGQGSVVSCGLASQKPQIIVVASLIDKLPNLAGLARTCEVFQATALALADVRVVKEPNFASISVTAERWIPVMEVKEAALLPWLEKQKQAGWELVGLEQTAEAVALPVFTWPKKAVLVLGREKEGLPAEVIQLLDHTVEIPQFGIIRSLNVHVSAAITIYEFTKQARMS